MLDRDSAIPLHTQLAALLRSRIHDHQLLPNTQLPSERELCDAHGVSRITVRNALNELLHEGLVYTAVGKGTYVADWALSEELQPLSSFSDDLKRRGLEVSSRVLEARVVAAGYEIAEQLQVPPGAEVVRLYRLRLADGALIALQLSHLPHHLCPGLANYDFTTRSLFETLRTEYGHQLLHADTTISAALPRAEETRLLQLSTRAAVLISEQTTYLEEGSTIEVTRSVFRGDRYKLHVTY
jgi:GntR family transcriptional regulator